MKRRQVNLSEQQRQDLLHLRDHDPLPSVRLKAAGILKVADGLPIRWVAAHGLNRSVRKNSLCRWISRYLEQGRAGLLVQSGRGRKPVFSPCP